ncbi:DYH14 protein, partial [Psophia crepitans]|nr:DYH14 protein [Psophia crepitans]
SVVKKYPILCTAVYRASTERKHKAEIRGRRVFSRIHKKGREEAVCQPTSMSEPETKKLKRSITKTVSLMSKNEDLKKALPKASACKGVQHGFGTSPPYPVYGKVPKMTEKPIDDDVMMHILRLRGKLGWQTKLPSCKRLARGADVARFQKFTLTRPLLLKDSGEYICCLQRNRNNFNAPYNPYDLQAVSTNTAMHSKECWTVTAPFVSKEACCDKLGETEITPVPQWLHERQLYYRLLSLNLFSNFRMKKYFLVWKIN